ncbi:MAG: HesA/MoeB/ThiF family protein [Planctomycetes bacterium]|nr:HesA/MoeB/ThiF family protein [Planctomycetota bacterium]
MSISPEQSRYHRQIKFAGLGQAGQKRLGQGKVLVVGVGGLGTWSAELLARAGVAFLRLVDSDKVDLSNIHRQSLFDEAHATAGTHKVLAAAERLNQINGRLSVETAVERLEARNVAALARDVDLILDGTDNFQTRFLLNDYSIKTNLPWIFAGAVGAEAQVMPVVPGQTACLRCLIDEPPPPCVDPNCQVAGVLGPAVAAIASIQAMEAIKILAGKTQAVATHILKLDLWANTIQTVASGPTARRQNCPCCSAKKFEYLDG